LPEAGRSVVAQVVLLRGKEPIGIGRKSTPVALDRGSPILPTHTVVGAQTIYNRGRSDRNSRRKRSPAIKLRSEGSRRIQFLIGVTSGRLASSDCKFRPNIHSVIKRPSSWRTSTSASRPASPSFSANSIAAYIACNLLAYSENRRRPWMIVHRSPWPTTTYRKWSMSVLELADRPAK
jgi:hypothetical protein